METNYSFAERVVDGVIHAIGIVAALIALPLLIVFAASQDPELSLGSLIVYAVASLAMLVFSAAYNLIPAVEWKDRLRRFDQAAIFMKIAGTYTPFTLMKLSGALANGMLASVWAIALFAAVSKLFLPRLLEGISIGLYLALGWAVLVVIGPLAEVMPTDAMVLLAVGGSLYTIGVVFHLWEKLPYQNAIWHGFVLLAASCHYTALLRVVSVA